LDKLEKKFQPPSATTAEVESSVQDDEDLQPMWKDMESRVKNRRSRTLAENKGRAKLGEPTFGKPMKMFGWNKDFTMTLTTPIKTRRMRKKADPCSNSPWCFLAGIVSLGSEFCRGILAIQTGRDRCDLENTFSSRATKITTEERRDSRPFSLCATWLCASTRRLDLSQRVISLNSHQV